MLPLGTSPTNALAKRLHLVSSISLWCALSLGVSSSLAHLRAFTAGPGTAWWLWLCVALVRPRATLLHIDVSTVSCTVFETCHRVVDAFYGLLHAYLLVHNINHHAARDSED